MTKVVLAGAATGCWSNLGDEALLVAALASLRAADPGVHVTVVSSSPPGYFRRYGSDEVRYSDVDELVSAITTADAVVFAGGSIFFDYWGVEPAEILTPVHSGLTLWATIAFAAAVARVPLVAWGVGVGPLRTPAGRMLAASVVALCDRVVVRDMASRDELVELGVWRDGDFSVGVDPVLGLAGGLAPIDDAEPTVPPTGRRVVAVGVREWDIDVDSDALAVVIAAICDSLVRELDVEVLFVPCHRSTDWPLTDDTAAATRVRDAMEHPGSTSAVSPHLGWSLRARCFTRADAVVAMRFHAALLGLASGSPTLGISYDPKVTNLFEQWEREDWCRTTPELVAGDPSAVAEAFTATCHRTWSSPAELGDLVVARSRLLEQAERQARCLLTDALRSGDCRHRGDVGPRTGRAAVRGTIEALLAEGIGEPLPTIREQVLHDLQAMLEAEK